LSISQFFRPLLNALLFLCVFGSRFSLAAGLPVIQVFKAPGVGETMSAAGISSDGSRIVIDDFQKSDVRINQLSTRVCDIATGKVLFELKKGPEDQSIGVKISPDGRYLLISTLTAAGLTSSSIRDLESNRDIDPIPARTDYFGGFFRPDGSCVYISVPSALQAGQIEDGATFAVVNLKSGQTTPTFQLPGRGPYDVAPDAKRAFCEMGISEMLSGRRICKLESADGLAYFAAQVFPADGTTYRVANRDGVVFTWDTQTGKLLSRVEPQSVLASQTMAFSRDGSKLIVNTRRGLFFYNAGTLRPLGNWTIPSTANITIAHAAPSPDEISVNNGPRADGDLLIVLPTLEALAPAPLRVIPATTPAKPNRSPGAIPPPAGDDLTSANWWLDRAESDLDSISTTQLREAARSSLIEARAHAGDITGADRLLEHAISSPAQIAYLRNLTTRESIRQFAAAGRMQDALAVAQTSGPPGNLNQECWSDLAVAHARAGDWKAAIKTVLTLKPEMEGRAGAAAVDALIAAGNLADARTLADQIPTRQLANGAADDFWRQSSIERISRAKAASGDIDGAIADVASLTAPSVRAAACQNVAASAAAKKDDEGALRIAASLVAEERSMSLHYVAQAQLERGDIPAALKTSQKLHGLDQLLFERSLAQRRIQVGQITDAIEAVQDSTDPEVLGDTFNAALKYKQFDAARQPIALLPAIAPRLKLDPADYTIFAERKLAVSLANADQLSAAKKLLADSDAKRATSPARKNSDPNSETSLAISAAELRAGDRAAYDRTRQPLVDAVNAVTGAPSRRDAMFNLIDFDAATHNVDALEEDIRGSDPDNRRETVQLVGMTMLDPSWSQRGPENLSEDRMLLGLILQTNEGNPVEPWASNIARAVARLHAEGARMNEFLTWSMGLSSVESQFAAFVAAAAALNRERPPTGY